MEMRQRLLRWQSLATSECCSAADSSREKSSEIVATLATQDFDLDLTGFNPIELDELLRDPITEERADEAPPLPEIATTQLGDLWLLGEHRVLCGDATSPEAVARLLNGRKPLLMVIDSPYGVELDSEWRDRAAGINKRGPGEPS